jgi:hypothetical protein
VTAGKTGLGSVPERREFFRTMAKPPRGDQARANADLRGGFFNTIGWLADMRISWFFEKASLTIFKLIFCFAST